MKYDYILSVFLSPTFRGPKKFGMLYVSKNVKGVPPNLFVVVAALTCLQGRGGIKGLHFHPYITF